jgi:hypothetical protein
VNSEGVLVVQLGAGARIVKAIPARVLAGLALSRPSISVPFVSCPSRSSVMIARRKPSFSGLRLVPGRAPGKVGYSGAGFAASTKFRKKTKEWINGFKGSC